MERRNNGNFKGGSGFKKGFGHGKPVFRKSRFAKSGQSENRGTNAGEGKITFGDNSGANFERKPEGSSFAKASEGRGGFRRGPRPHNGGGGFSHRRGGGRGRSRGKSGGGFRGTSINVHQLINKVNDEAFIKPTEEVVQEKFDDFMMDPRIKRNVAHKGYISPTPIQAKAIPVALTGRDVIGVANTGTGKTAAFLLPLINKMLDDRTQKVIILAPTRELAVQINDELRGFTKGFNLFSVLVIGGASIGMQARQIRTPFNFLIGTPGRVIDLYERKLLDLSRFQNVVLDEVDRMMDMGFVEDMRMILGKVQKNRHSLFFTATIEPKVEELMKQFMNSPVKISVKMRDTSANIEQDILHVPKDNKKKEKILIELLKEPEFDKVLVFARTKHGVEKISDALRAAGIRAEFIHGDKSQSFRLRALHRFKKGEVRVLIATNVAARGLDIKAVSHVINFDIPANYEDYVHRIGRTDRADKKGIALTFVEERSK